MSSIFLLRETLPCHSLSTDLFLQKPTDDYLPLLKNNGLEVATFRVTTYFSSYLEVFYTNSTMLVFLYGMSDPFSLSYTFEYPFHWICYLSIYSIISIRICGRESKGLWLKRMVSNCKNNTKKYQIPFTFIGRYTYYTLINVSSTNDKRRDLRESSLIKNCRHVL